MPRLLVCTCYLVWCAHGCAYQALFIWFCWCPCRCCIECELRAPCLHASSTQTHAAHAIVFLDLSSCVGLGAVQWWGGGTPPKKCPQRFPLIIPFSQFPEPPGCPPYPRRCDSLFFLHKIDSGFFLVSTHYSQVDAPEIIFSIFSCD